MSIDCVRRLSVRNSANLREIYSRNFLFRALLPAARHCDDSEYAKFQLSTISRYLDEFGIAGILVRITNLIRRQMRRPQMVARSVLALTAAVFPTLILLHKIRYWGAGTVKLAADFNQVQMMIADGIRKMILAAVRNQEAG